MSSKHHKEPKEFGGTFGVLAIYFFLPAVVYSLYFFCNKDQCGLPFLSDIQIPDLRNLKEPIFTWEALYVVVGWMVFQALLHIILPGEIVKGMPIKEEKDKRLDYKLNGFSCQMISLVVVCGAAYLKVIPATYAYDNFVPLITGASIFALALSIYLYVVSFFNRTTNLSPGGNTGDPIYDFWIGRQLNPRIGNFDLKFICELHPGLTAWCLINLSCAAKQYENTGSVSAAMIFVVVAEGIYIADAVFKEEAILSTVDIIHDGFGFMLAFGDLVWVPFTFCTQARYLVDYNVEWSPAALVALSITSLTGYYIFRMSNWQKHIFRTNPTDPRVKHLKTLNTKAGTKLLITGWWGISRHINYFGDWLQSFGWCLACGFNHIIPYFYSVYFGVLLIHRGIRDDVKCQNKYGKDWDEYCRIVKYRIIPYVY